MEPDRTGDEMVEFGGQRIRPDLVGDVVEIELLVDRLAEQARHHAEHGPKAACGCPARLDGTDPYRHRDGCPRQGELQVERWLREHGGGDHGA